MLAAASAATWATCSSRRITASVPDFKPCLAPDARPARRPAAIPDLSPFAMPAWRPVVRPSTNATLAASLRAAFASASSAAPAWPSRYPPIASPRSISAEATRVMERRLMARGRCPLPRRRYTCAGPCCREALDRERGSPVRPLRRRLLPPLRVLLGFGPAPFWRRRLPFRHPLFAPLALRAAGRRVVLCAHLAPALSATHGERLWEVLAERLGLDACSLGLIGGLSFSEQVAPDRKDDEHNGEDQPCAVPRAVKGVSRSWHQSAGTAMSSAAGASRPDPRKTWRSSS